ncbi:magnesium transporter [Thioalkalivibrio versutus]|uniref:Magnesium transport protein CorA n=1 Tax=Thioalkalivibrio versutus TaxID=106634 RepID=A0A0G3FZL1_9GAMM|nr:magnesium/cobalt transporter CorA [Thioalkalivibrio versutus]AKJ94383.1 magnesium transporter [Thioalkalivibrio versutus]
MTRLFEKTYLKPGAAPGHGAHATEHPHAADATVSAWHYHREQLVELDPQRTLREGVQTVDGGFVWLHLQGAPSPRQLHDLGEAFDLHPLALEDVRHQGQRPKVDFFDAQMVAILRQPRHHNGNIELDQLNLFVVGTHLVISVHSGAADPFGPVRERMRNANRNFNRLGAAYLAYALMDSVIDQAFPVLEHISERLETLEETVLDQPDRHTLNEIHILRRELLVLRRQLWPTRDVIARLMRDDLEPFTPELFPYLRDAYDHTIQIMDLLESYREMAATLIEAYMSAINQRSNDVMRVLTIIATIFIPLTFIVGIYGMNFEHPDSPWSMPELYTYYGYPILLGIMLAVVAVMLYLFRRRGWL